MKISRKTLLNLTMVLYALLLLISTLWTRWLGLSLLPALQFNYRALLFGAAVGVAMSASGYALYLASRRFGFLAQFKHIIEQMLMPLLAELQPVDIVLIAALSGFCEEVFFRGVAQHQFGLPLTSIAFGLFHDPTLRNVSYAIVAAVYGLVLGLLYIKTGNLWAPIIAHATHNFISLVVLRYFVKPPASTAT